MTWGIRPAQLFLGAFTAAALVAAILLSLGGHIDVGGLVLTVVVLVIADLTLLATWATPGELRVDRQDELPVDTDLIFFTPADTVVAGAVVPRDILLQVHIAVSNVGGRKAVLSTLALTRFLDASGSPVTSQVLPVPVQATSYRQWESRELMSGTMNMQSETVAPPFVLEADDVVTLRIRARSGIDWSTRWDLESLRSVYDSLAIDVAQADLSLVFRRGPTVVRRSVRISVRVRGQASYRLAIAQSTNQWKTFPQGKRQRIDPRG